MKPVLIQLNPIWGTATSAPHLLNPQHYHCRVSISIWVWEIRRSLSKPLVCRSECPKCHRVTRVNVGGSGRGRVFHNGKKHRSWIHLSPSSFIFLVWLLWNSYVLARIIFIIHLFQCLWISLQELLLSGWLYTGTLNLPTHFHSLFPVSVETLLIIINLT